SAVFTRLPTSLTIARMRPCVLPTTSESPTCNVPFCTNIVATEPLPLSNSASMTVPKADFSGSLLILPSRQREESFLTNHRFLLYESPTVSQKLCHRPNLQRSIRVQSILA